MTAFHLTSSKLIHGSSHGSIHGSIHFPLFYRRIKHWCWNQLDHFESKNGSDENEIFWYFKRHQNSRETFYFLSSIGTWNDNDGAMQHGCIHLRFVIFPSLEMKNIRQGPLLVWNWQERLATITNKAGVWTGPHHNEWKVGGDLCHMFDGNPNTYWHSAASKENEPKILKIEFKVL